MEKLSHKWDQIVAKVHMLLEKNHKLETELAQIKSQIVKSNSEKDQLIKEKEDLNKNIKVLMLAKGVGLSDEERSEVKKQIKHYINEIDDCLAQINA